MSNATQTPASLQTLRQPTKLPNTMKTVQFKPLVNFSHVSKRIAKVAAADPASPIKGRGFVRTEIFFPLVFAKLQKLAPKHCEIVMDRRPINNFGKLGFVGLSFVSPELEAVIGANYEDFKRLEQALKTVSESGI